MKNVNLNLQILLLLGMAVIFSNCCKEKNQDKPGLTNLQKLPPLTHVGKGTFGCLVDGEAWIPNEWKDTRWCFYYSYFDSRDIYGTLELRSLKKKFLKDSPASMFMHLNKRVFGTGKHLLYLDGPSENYLSVSKYYREYYCKKKDSNNNVNIHTLDTVNRIVSGTFQFYAIGLDNNLDTVKVTDGRFDLRY
jgi:hypothetical protein